MKMLVYDSLRYGRENAIPSKVLAEMLGFRTVRDLQKEVERERTAGAVILSTCHDGGGYYRSDDPEELHRFVQTLRSRAANTFRAAQSAQHALNTISGQESISGWFDG